MKLVVIGTGYVGLVTGTCLAETGHTVFCVDLDDEKIKKLNAGILPIYEPGLKEILERNLQKKRLFFSTAIADVLSDAHVVFIAVGTPALADGSTDLTYVLKAAEDIANAMTGYIVVVNKSTVPPGTADQVTAIIQKTLAARGITYGFDVISNPEFLKEGNSVNDFLKPDRIIIGSNSDQASDLMRRLYQPFILNGHPLFFMDVVSAEMTKYAANAMLATRISFMNEMANLCERVGANMNWVRKGLASDPRIGSQFLYAGIGYGGSCFPKDVQSLIHTGQSQNCPMAILEAVHQVNDWQKFRLFEKCRDYFQGNLQGKTIGVWGLSFKPRTDDVREAPALYVIPKLLAAGCHVQAYDPVANAAAREVLGDQVAYCDSQYSVLANADCLMIFTEWSEFRSPDFDLLKEHLKEPLIFDGRNIFEPADMKALGFTYFGIGI